MAKKEYQADMGKPSKTARALITDANVSLKFSTEIANQIRGQLVNKAIAKMKRIIAHEEYLPLKKYHMRVGHRKGQALLGEKAGRYPEMTCSAFIDLLKLAKNNADNKGLDPEKLIILNAFASKGISRYSYQSKGKIAGKAKRKNATHIEVLVLETK